ncbi:MAG: M50 family metallopeptidase [Lactobacillaceae bacterium]|jgi:hypothetical protein|nr:M50 family metallopeptidase [Lactobacillaceae bacterium]
MRHTIDKFLELLKWPVAIIALLSLPALIESFSFKYFKFSHLRYLVMGAGFILFFISRTMADKSVKVTMQIAAHEFTHAFFALITMHKINHIRLNPDNSGGEMGFKGKGNWLIIISPYFFPLLAFFYMITVSIYTKIAPVNDTINLILSGFLGYFLAYHVDTVVSQIHEKQTDLTKAKYSFCVMFLPSANLWTIGCILAFNSRGWEGMWAYTRLIGKLNMDNLKYILSYIF